jgi:hypothetical protein
VARINDYKYRLIDQPGGWTGNTVKVDWPILVNLRLDPFERTSLPDQSMNQYSWFAYEFWRFEALAKTLELIKDFLAVQP